MRKNILFIQPFQFVKKKMFNEIQIWPVYLDNFLKSKIRNFNSDIIYLPDENEIDLNCSNFISLEGLNKLHSGMDKLTSELNFELDDNFYVCISGTTSYDFLPTKLIAEYFQKYYPKIIVLFGGSHASASPYDFSYEKSPIDYVVIGEGEISLYELLKKTPKKRKIPQILENNPVPDLNDLPPLDLSLFDKYIKNHNHLSINISRGCPYDCSYCVERDLRKKDIKGWRVYTPERALKEAKTLIEYGLNQNVNIFGFHDPIFGVDKEWLEKFLESFKIDDRISRFWIESRVDLLNERLLRAVLNKGMIIMYGLESFSKTQLKIMNKTVNPTDYLNRFEKILEIHRELNCKHSLNFVFNHPGETKESYQETFNRIIEIAETDNSNLTHFEIVFFHIFPGTQNYLNFKENNEKYGTKLYFPEWWKKPETLELGTFCVKPSFDLTLRESYELFVKNQIPLFKVLYNKEKENKGAFENFLQRTMILKNQQNKLLNFLNENKIEA